jgi:hypothetical protein
LFTFFSGISSSIFLEVSAFLTGFNSSVSLILSAFFDLGAGGDYSSSSSC